MDYIFCIATEMKYLLETVPLVSILDEINDEEIRQRMNATEGVSETIGKRRLNFRR